MVEDSIQVFARCREFVERLRTPDYSGTTECYPDETVEFQKGVNEAMRLVSVMATIAVTGGTLNG